MNIPCIDLHIHSTASDGTDSPSAIVHKAAEIGLDAIALTDHDTLDGLDAADKVSPGFKSKVLSGEVHFLTASLPQTYRKLTAKLRKKPQNKAMILQW